jgi:hypothetical protein
MPRRPRNGRGLFLARQSGKLAVVKPPMNPPDASSTDSEDPLSLHEKRLEPV